MYLLYSSSLKARTIILFFLVSVFNNHLISQVTIDDFSYTQSVVASGSSAASGTETDPGAPSSILGSERDIFIQGTSGGSIIFADVSAGTFSFNTAATNSGDFYIMWDGVDGLAGLGDIDYVGLGGQDFTLAGDAISLTISSADGPGTINFEVYTDASNSSTYSLAYSVISSGSPITFDIPFSSFVTNLGTGADFSNVGAVVLSGSSGSGVDIGMDLFSVVLPVEWLDFYIEKQHGHPVLNWSTAAEIENTGFDIQRTVDGRNWERLGFTEGHGTTNDISNYSFKDESALSGTFYYRLKQIDSNGKTNYSSISSIELTESRPVVESVTLYPNPASDVLFIEGQTGTANIYNAFGQHLMQFELENFKNEIDIAHLISGMYILEIDAGGETIVKTFNK